MTCFPAESIPALGRAIQGFVAAARSLFPRYAIVEKSGEMSPVTDGIPSEIPSTTGSWKNLPQPRNMNRPQEPGSKARLSARSPARARSIVDTTSVRRVATPRTSRRLIAPFHRMSCRTALAERHLFKKSPSSHGHLARIPCRIVIKLATRYLIVAITASTDATRAPASPVSRLSILLVDAAGPRPSLSVIKATYSLRNVSVSVVPSSAAADTNAGLIVVPGRRRPWSGGSRSGTRTGSSKSSTSAYSPAAELSSVGNTVASNCVIRALAHHV